MNRIVENFLNDLTDFSNVAISSRYSHLGSVEKPLSSARELDYDIQDLDFGNHTRLLEQFRRLRQKMKAQTKKVQQIRKEWSKSQKKYQEKIEKMQIKQAESMAAMKYLKKEIQVINSGIDKLKIRNTELEKQALSTRDIVLQKDNLIQRVNQLNAEIESLCFEKQKIKQIVLLEKLQLEGKLNQMTTISNLDMQHYRELQEDLLKSKQLIITLQSRIQQLHDEQRVRSIQRHENSSALHLKQQQLQATNLQLKRQNEKLRKLYEQQKSQRKKNQTVSHKKQELAGLYQLQNQVQQRQLNNLKKRVQKLTDRYEMKSVQAECQAFKSMQTLTKLFKSIEIANQLIHRLKKQGSLPHDIDKLMKACDYKLNKIKQSQTKNNNFMISSKRIVTNPNSAKHKKSISRSRSKSPNTNSNYTAQKSKQLSLQKVEFHSYSTPKLKSINSPSKIDVGGTVAITSDSKKVEEKIRREMREKESELRRELQFQKYSKIPMKGSC